ncbi:MAG: DNA_ligase_IV_Ku-like, partial [uncultured Thermoleophilia bacterium]
LRRGPARRRVAEGQAAPHARPGRAGRGVGARTTPGVAEQPPPGGPRRPDGRVRHAGQDVQGAHRRDADVADRAPPRARGAADDGDRLGAAGARRRGRVRRRAGQHALPRRRGAPLRTGPAAPAGQDRRAGRHAGRRAGRGPRL